MKANIVMPAFVAISQQRQLAKKTNTYEPDEHPFGHKGQTPAQMHPFTPEMLYALTHSLTGSQEEAASGI